MQRVLVGDLFAWGLMLHAKIIRHIYRCRNTNSSDFVFGSILVACFFERVSMLCHRVLLPPAGMHEPRLMSWAQILVQNEGKEGGHIAMCVAPHATGYPTIPIWWDGFSARPGHGFSSRRGVGPERYVCVFILCNFDSIAYGFNYMYVDSIIVFVFVDVRP
jgi:hypothetical protein